MSTLNIVKFLLAAFLGLTYGLKSVSAFGFSRNGQVWTSPRVLPTAPFTRPVVSSLGMSGGPATLEPPTTTKKKEKSKDAVKDEEQKGSQGNWEVRLFNDPMNKREFVARCLMEIVGLSDGAAYQVMMQAHQNGLSVIGRFHHERAELYRNSLVEQGLVVDMVPCEDD